MKITFELEDSNYGEKDRAKNMFLAEEMAHLLASIHSLCDNAISCVEEQRPSLEKLCKAILNETKYLPFVRDYEEAKQG